MYGFGQISELVLANYWCDSKTLEQIHEHSIEYGLNGGTNNGCWKSKEYTVDEASLFDSSSIYETTADFTMFNIIRCCIWLLYAVWFFCNATLFMSLVLADLGIEKTCWTNSNGDEATKNKNFNKNNTENINKISDSSNNDDNDNNKSNEKNADAEIELADLMSVGSQSSIDHDIGGIDILTSGPGSPSATDLSGLGAVRLDTEATNEIPTAVSTPSTPTAPVKIIDVMAAATQNEKQSSNSQDTACRHCCPCCCCKWCIQNTKLNAMADLYLKFLQWFKIYFGEDTQLWFVFLLIRELIEIFLQMLAIYNYNGLNIFDQDEIVLAYKESEIKLFCILLSLNCILVGLLWLFYTCCYQHCHGYSFKQLLFFIDTIFDTFYALFPIILITNENGFNLQTSVAVLQTTNTFSILVVFDLLCVQVCSPGY